MNNKMREDFEKFAADHHLLSERSFERDEHHTDEYLDPDCQVAWESWQTSREGIVLELPSFRFGRQLNGDELEEQDDGDYLFYHEVVEIIEAQGFKVKTK